MAKKRSSSLIFAATFLLLMSATTSRAQPKPQLWRTEKLPGLHAFLSEEYPPNRIHDFIVDDFDGDGSQEFCQLRSDSNHPLFIAIREFDNISYTYPGHAISLEKKDQRLFPLGGESVFRFGTYHQVGSKGWIDLYNHKAKRIDSVATLCGSDFSGDGQWTGLLRDLFLLDVNRDHRRDLVAFFNTGADQQPRALVAYDLAAKSCLLEIHFAPMLASVLTADVDGDGASELILGLAGASDGPYFGPFSRDSSYVAVMKSDGRILAKRAFAGESSYCSAAIADIDGDLLPEILVSSYSMLQGGARESVLLALDGRSLAKESELINAKGMGQIYQIGTSDLDRDGSPEIIAIDLANNVAILRHASQERTLVITARIRTEDVARYIMASDINHDRQAEMFFATDMPAVLWLVDSQLKPLAWLPLRGRAEDLKLAPLDHSAADVSVFSLLDGGALYRLSIPVAFIFRDPKALFEWRGIRFRIGSAALLLLIGIFLLSLVGASLYCRRRLDKAGHFPVNLFSNRIGQAFIDGKGQVQRCNPYFLRLIGQDQKSVVKHPFAEILARPDLEPLLRTLEMFNKRNEFYWQQEISLPVEGRIQDLAVELIRNQSRSSRMVVLLVDLSENLQKERLKIWAAMALRMAHKTKTPLATVLLAIQRLQRAYKKNSPEFASEYDELSKAAMREIERVRDSINTFMKFGKLDPPYFVLDDLSRVVEEALQEYLPRIPDDVQVRTHFETLDLPVNIDISQFKEAFYNLLDNAINATQGQGLLSVSTLREKNPLSQLEEKDMALLEIADNGEGITAKDVPQLFTPGFSTSLTGSGMGLVLAKSIIESHGGSIEIDSRRLSGTVVFVRLPVFNT